MYSKLFEPIKIGSLEIKNRFVVPAMDSHYTDENHYFTNQAVNYYGKRAEGGFGLIFTEFLCVSEEGLAESTQAGIYDDCFIEMMSTITKRVHENGSVIFAQLQHSGRLQGDNITELMPVGPSNIIAANKTRKVHELTIEEIQVIIRKFVDAAIRAKKAGFDGVEIHGAHGYLLAQFLSKGVNKRIDRYGGNITNRARIVVEIIKAIKDECGNDFPVSVRTSGNEDSFGFNSIEDAVAQAILFEEAGADVINVSHGVAIQSNYINNGFNIDNVRRIKEVVSIPVIGVGRINDASLALSAIKSNSMDLVVLGRQSICDPEFPNKVKEGRINEIYTCTGCLQRCLYTNAFEEGFGTSCMINPFSGKEGIWEINKAEVIKNIIIVGAGVAGLQAAWILAKKGHKVTVFEKDSVAGGQYRLAAVPSMKQDLAKTISTYLAFCDKYGVEIKYNIEVTKDMLANFDYDELILACGSLPIIPNIKGIDQANVCSALDVLRFEKQFNNQKLLVLGAGLVGVETAELLAEYGNKVMVVDMLDKAAPLAPKRPRLHLLQHVKELNVDFMFNSKVLEIISDGIICECNNERIVLNDYDGIVLAFGSKANQELFSENDNVYLIGDAFKASDAKKAIFEATKLALKL